VTRCARDERHATAQLVAHLAELDLRRLYLGAGKSSLFTYCRDVLGASRHRCSERSFLEYHHVLPYAVGGEATVANIQLRCRAHNGYEADVFFGTDRGNRLGADGLGGVQGTTLFRGVSRPFRNGRIGSAAFHVAAKGPDEDPGDRRSY
jgi:hypothetical protein